MRVIFDRSAFHGENFDTLNNSPVREVLAHGRATIFHTPVCIDETIASYEKQGSAGDWKKHLAFMLDVCNGGYFLPKVDIWRNALARSEGTHALHLYPARESKHYDSAPRLTQTLRRVAESGDLASVLADARKELQEMYDKKKNQKAIAREFRDEIADAYKAGKLKPAKGYPFSEYLNTLFLGTGANFASLVDPDRKGELGGLWQQNPARYPYYSAFIEGALYAGYYAAIEQNLPLDMNAQADYEQLAYLTWADVVVSNEQRFFASAFKTIWEPRGKRMVSAAEFAKLMQALA